MHKVNIHQAKTHLSKLVDSAMHGEEIIIAKAGVPIVKLVAIKQVETRQFGVLKGKIKISNDFDDPLPDDLLKDFEGE